MSRKAEQEVRRKIKVLRHARTRAMLVKLAGIGGYQGIHFTVGSGTTKRSESLG